MTTRDVTAPVQPVLPARLTELALFLDVEGTPCNASLSVATPPRPRPPLPRTIPPVPIGPAAAMGVFILNHPPEWSPEQKARVARDLATALHAAADDIAGQWGNATAWGG